MNAYELYWTLVSIYGVSQWRIVDDARCDDLITEEEYSLLQTLVDGDEDEEDIDTGQYIALNHSEIRTAIDAALSEFKRGGRAVIKHKRYGRILIAHGSPKGDIDASVKDLKRAHWIICCHPDKVANKNKAIAHKVLGGWHGVTHVYFSTTLNDSSVMYICDNKRQEYIQARTQGT